MQAEMSGRCLSASWTDSDGERRQTRAVHLKDRFEQHTDFFLTDKGGRMVSTHPRRMDSDCGQSKFKNLAEGYSLLTGFNNSFEINFKNLTDEKILKI